MQGSKEPQWPVAAGIVLASPNWGVRCGGHSHPRSEQFRCLHRTRGPLYGKL
jgi:hypothetical protein